MLFFSFLITLILITTSHSLPPNTSLATPLLRRAAPDPSDLSWIKTWASVGDSYSVGIGHSETSFMTQQKLISVNRAGTRLNGWGDYFCSRYDESFPAIVNSDDRLGSPQFTYWPCSGANTDDVISQVNALADGSQDFITITSGGNDAYLTAILNECIYQWYSGATPLTSQCPDQLHKSFDVITSSDFHSKLDKLLNSAKSKLKPGGLIYYIGYAQFFGQESNQCDSITWAYWYVYGKREYLTRDKRTRMNTLVTNMNDALKDAVTRAGPSVTFIDYDHYYTISQGRYCEDRYVETSPNRYGLLFYEWYTDDNKPETNGLTAQDAPPPSVITPGLVMNGTFEGDINDYIRRTLAQHPSWHNNATTAQGAPPSINSVNATEAQIVVGYSAKFVPDDIGRVFHPRPNGHQLIANLILYHLEAANAARLHQPWPPEEITSDVCPAPGAASPSQSPSPSSVPTPTSTPKPTSSSSASAPPPATTSYTGTCSKLTHQCSYAVAGGFKTCECNGSGDYQCYYDGGTCTYNENTSLCQCNS